MKTKITQVNPAPGSKPSARKNTTLSNRDKTLALFWGWELTYRCNGLFFDWPSLRGLPTSIRGGRTCKVVSSIHSVLLFFLSCVNCLRYGPYIIQFSGLTAEMAVILFYTFVYSSGIWHYALHMCMMSRDFSRMAESLARVFQTLNAPPRVRRVKTIVGFYLSLAVLTWSVSTVPIYRQVMQPEDAGEEQHLKNVRLLPTQPNTTLNKVALYVYAYVSFFMYFGFYTLIAYIIFFCYVVGHAFGEITQRLYERAKGFQPYCPENDDVVSDVCQSAETRPVNTLSEKVSMMTSSGVEFGRYDVKDEVLGNPDRHYLCGNAIDAMKGLLVASDELDVKILHLHHSSASKRPDRTHPNTSQRPDRSHPNASQRPDQSHLTTSLRVGHFPSPAGKQACSRPSHKMGNDARLKGPCTGPGQLETRTLAVKSLAPEEQPTTRASSVKKEETPAALTRLAGSKHDPTVSTTSRKAARPTRDLKGGEDARDFVAAENKPTDVKRPGKDNDQLALEWPGDAATTPTDSGESELGEFSAPYGSEVEYLRHHHMRLIEIVRLADSVLGGVVFAVYWEGILMACFALYSLVVDAFPRSEYFPLCFALVMATVQILCCTSASAWLSEKAQSQEAPLLLLNMCSLTEQDFRSVSVFLIQLRREHIGITAFGLFPVNRATYLTIAGTIITYAVVILQFNSGCPTPDLGTGTNVTLDSV